MEEEDLQTMLEEEEGSDVECKAGDLLLPKYVSDVGTMLIIAPSACLQRSPMSWPLRRTLRHLSHPLVPVDMIILIDFRQLPLSGDRGVFAVAALRTVDSQSSIATTVDGDEIVPGYIVEEEVWENQNAKKGEW